MAYDEAENHGVLCETLAFLAAQYRRDAHTNQ
jgi:hypothetical protein